MNNFGEQQGPERSQNMDLLILKTTLSEQVFNSALKKMEDQLSPEEIDSLITAFKKRTSSARKPLPHPPEFSDGRQEEATQHESESRPTRERLPEEDRYIQIPDWKEIKAKQLAKRTNPQVFNSQTGRSELEFPSDLPNNMLLVAQVDEFVDHGSADYTIPISHVAVCQDLKDMQYHSGGVDTGRYAQISFFLVPRDWKQLI